VVDEVLVQVGDDGEFQNVNLCAAWKGFSLLGRDAKQATLAEIEATEATPSTLVFGGVEAVRPYLDRLGRDPPELDYPEALSSYLGREVRLSTLGEIRSLYHEDGPAVFVKPVRQKLFKGHVVSRFRDLIGTASFPSDTPVYVVDPVDFVSEWRFYVRGSDVAGVGHYRGDPLLFPRPDNVLAAVEDFAVLGAPVAYGLDFGVVRGGQTLLVEVNDMFSLGSYGLDPVLYATMIEERWEEIVGPS